MTRIRVATAFALSASLVAAALVAAATFVHKAGPSRLDLPVLGPAHVVPGRHASVKLPPGWRKLPSKPQGAVVAFRCYTAAMFVYLPWAEERARIDVDPARRTAEAYRGGLGLAFTYDVHAGCRSDDYRQASEDILALLNSFRPF
jgi:hypothetical protein